MQNLTLIDTHVVICDWHGVVRWISADETLLKKGDFLWQHVIDADQEKTINAFGKVIALQRSVVLEIEKKSGRLFRIWLWPLESAEMAVCALRMQIPRELRLLSDRERDTVNLLALGTTPKDIAKRFDLSISTVHTHLRRAREKLKINNNEALIAFASRHCQQGWETTGVPKSAPKMDGGMVIFPDKMIRLCGV